MTLEMKFQEREREAVARAVTTATLAAREEGISLGREEGVALGMQRGREEGIQQGALQKALEMAANLKNMSFPLDKIAKATGLTLEEVRAL